MSGVPDYTLEDTIDFKFTTRRFSTGAPFAFDSGAIEIYEDNSDTQITSAETLTLEFDGVAGLHNLRVVATAANGFENGKSYHCVVSVGTVDSVSVVGEVVQQFSIGRSAAAADLANATDGLGALKTLIDTVNTALSNGTDGLGALKTLIDTVNTDLSNGTDGLGALKTLIDTVNTDLSNSIDGLGALKTLIDAIQTSLNDGVTFKDVRSIAWAISRLLPPLQPRQ